MSRPKKSPGCCQFYDKSFDKCYLAENTPLSSTREQKCKNESRCTTCGNYEAWANGTNYKNK